MVLFHVLDPELVLVPKTQSRSLRLPMGIAQTLLDDLREVGERAGVQVSTETLTGPRVVNAIIERAGNEVDLVILGTSVRIGSPRLYLGPKVERLVREIECTTLIFNTAAPGRHRAP